MPTLQEAARELGAAYDDYFVLSDVLRRDGARVLDDFRADEPWRRNVVRVTWPMIEAYGSTLRRFCNIFRKYCDLGLSSKHIRLLDDDSQFGTAERIKETLKLAYRLHDLKEPPDFGDDQWLCVREAIEVRDRIMHPESAADLKISDENWLSVHAGLVWAVACFTRFLTKSTISMGLPPNKSMQTDQNKLSRLLHAQEPRQLALAADLGC